MKLITMTMITMNYLPLVDQFVSCFARLVVIMCCCSTAVTSKYDKILINGVNRDFKVQSLSEIDLNRVIIPSICMGEFLTAVEVHTELKISETKIEKKNCY